MQYMIRGQPEPVPGPLVARFRSYGGLCQGKLVAGPWGELSPHLHQLLKIFAESPVAAMGRAQVAEATEVPPPTHPPTPTPTKPVPDAPPLIHLGLTITPVVR